MNKLSISQQVQILTLLTEGNSLRSASRIADVSIVTVSKLLVAAGKAAEKFHDDNVINVAAKRVQCDEIWSFCYAKEKNTTDEMPEGSGDVWTWTAIDADSKLIVGWNVADRSPDAAKEFMLDIAGRLKNRVQLTTDGYKPYLEAVYGAFDLDVDYAMLVKLYGGADGQNASERKYSAAKFTGSKKTWVSGEPEAKHISTSYVERSNLTMRMNMRRFTRLTNAFSKKIENHCHAIALHFFHYNFIRQHKTLRITPAMAAGLTKRFMSLEDLVRMLPQEPPAKRGSYKKKIAAE